jgi:HK97 family phage portal protein
VFVNSDTDFSDEKKRDKFRKQYLADAKDGKPWILPADLVKIEQVKPLTLADLAIKDTVELDKRTVASIFGAPPHIIGIGNYDAKAHNGFVRTDIIHMATVWEQETTQKLLENPKRYYKISRRRLYDYDLKTLIDIDNSMADRGYLNGDEVREDAERDPIGLTERRVLENYIPIDMSGNQKKLIQQEE